jgi:hypothetical protein
MPAPRSVRNRRKSISKACALAGLFAASCSCGDEEVEPSRWQYPDSLLGSWVRVYPGPAGVDTVVVEPDGVARGPKSAVSADHIERITRWEISWIDPRSLCFGHNRHAECSGYQLRGDTLALANGQHTVLVRAASLGSEALASDSAEQDRGRWGEVPPAPRPPGRR